MSDLHTCTMVCAYPTHKISNVIKLKINKNMGKGLDGVLSEYVLLTYYYYY